MSCAIRVWELAPRTQCLCGGGEARDACCHEAAGPREGRSGLGGHWASGGTEVGRGCEGCRWYRGGGFIPVSVGQGGQYLLEVWRGEGMLARRSRLGTLPRDSERTCLPSASPV